MNKNVSRLIKLSFLVIVFILYFLCKDKISHLLFPKKINQPFQSINKNVVDEIKITYEGKTENIYKKNNQWYTKGEFIADQERINKMIDSVLTLTKEDVVSTNKKRHIYLGINNNKIVFKTQNQNYVLFIGNSSGIDKNYVRVDEENEAFLASGFTDIFAPFDYRDLKVKLISDENKVTSISINNLNLENKKDKWFIGTGEAKKDRVDFFLNDLKTLKATDISTKETTLSYPELTIKVKVDSKETTADFFPKDDGKENYYLKTSNSNNIFQIPTVYVNSLKKEEKDFIE